MNPDISPQEILKTLAALRGQGKISWKDQFTCANKIEHSVAEPLIGAVLARAGKSKEQLGEDMENLVHYLLENGGFFCNVQNSYENSVHQLDHWAEASPHVMDYLTSKNIKSLNFVGESKNYSDKLNVDKVYKLEGIKNFTNSKLGAFFTTFGLKGDFDRSAKALLTFYYHKMDHVTLIFSDEDWKFLIKDATKFPALFYEKLARFQATYESGDVDFDKV